MYKYKHYNNFKELENKNKKLAAELLEHFGDGFWMKTDILIFNNKKNFALFELESGWYFDSFKEDYNGAPDPLEFINFRKFANSLIDAWDESNHYITANKKIVMTVQ